MHDVEQIQQQPSTSHDTFTLDNLLLLFSNHFTAKQISTVYLYSGNDFDESMECLSNGASLEDILKMLNVQYNRSATVKVQIDNNESWSDMLAFYKCSSQLSKKHLRVCHSNEPAIDTGRVRRETYTIVFSEFVHNDHIHLFDGPTNHLRPHSSAEVRGVRDLCCTGIHGSSCYIAGRNWVSIPISTLLLVHCQGRRWGIAVC